MPQQFTLYPDLTARENVDFVASLFGILWRTRHRRTREVLQLVDLWDVRGRRAGRLSGGMQRRLELACALVHDPTLLFLDEPTAGIDPILRATIWEELHRLRDDGRTLLVTTQYVSEAEACDTVALISGGRLIALGHARGAAARGDRRRRRRDRDDRRLRRAALADMPDDPAASSGAARRRCASRSTTRRPRMPEVVEAITQRGGEVASAREDRPSFDEVFAILVERDRGRAGRSDRETSEAA